MSEIRFNFLHNKEMEIEDLELYMHRLSERKRFTMDDKIRIEKFLPGLLKQIDQ